MRIAGFELQRSIIVSLPNGPLAMTSIHSRQWHELDRGRAILMLIS